MKAASGWLTGQARKLQMRQGMLPSLRNDRIHNTARVAVGLLRIGLVILMSGCTGNREPVSFLKHWVIDPTPNTGEDCCTDVLMLGDLNGDGNLDVILGAEHATGPGLVWYEYPSWAKHPVASGEFTTDGKTADLDGDGDIDIVAATATESGSGELLWFENASKLGTRTWTPHHIGSGYTHDLEVGDLDGDGDLDVVTCDKNRVVAWEQVTPTSFREHVILTRPGEGIALADIDRDGDPDIVFGGLWLENPGAGRESAWVPHPIAPFWSPNTRVAVRDMNNDGRSDVALSVSEGEGGLSWFESPPNPRAETWKEHAIEKGMLQGAHSLQIGDFDGDGDLDVLTAEMHTSRKQRVVLYLNEGETFKPVILSRAGSHNLRVADLDQDGDLDIVGKNYAGKGRVLEMWENLTSIAKSWNYISIDDHRPKTEKGKMGLCFADANGDGFLDVVAGGGLYLNPHGELSNQWQRVSLGEDVDVHATLDANGNSLCDLIGIARNSVVWLEATKGDASAWRTRPVAKLTTEGRTQGCAVANVVRGPKPQVVFTKGKNLFCLEIPAQPDRDAWPLHCISTETEEEGVAAGDIDGDGDLDIAAVRADGQAALWLENPGMLTVKWKTHFVGAAGPYADRIRLADVNGDGRLDIIATEERQDWKLDAALYWFEAPRHPKEEPWQRHVIARHRSLNSLDVADIDGDGNSDVCVAEHTDQSGKRGALDNLTLVYFNERRGQSWSPQVVERGPHSSHLGARLVDLDHDGFPEIVSIAWDQYQHVHLWQKTRRRSGRDGSPNALDRAHTNVQPGRLETR